MIFAATAAPSGVVWGQRLLASGSGSMV